jgi:hypothetical protein
MNRYAAILVATFLICTLAGVLAGCDDFEIHQQQAEHYCAMVGMWKSDESLYLPPDQRRGWPDYRNEYEQVCMSSAERLDAYTMAQRAGRE